MDDKYNEQEVRIQYRSPEQQSLAIIEQKRVKLSSTTKKILCS